MVQESGSTGNSTDDSTGDSTMNRRAYVRLVGTGSLVGAAATVGILEGSGGVEAQEDEQAEQIVAGTAPGFPPFEVKEGDELVGFDIDLLEAVVAETEYELAEWAEFEFDSLIAALRSGRIDVIAAAMTITEERADAISFTNPYYSADQSILVRDDGDFQPESLEDLAGRRTGAQNGTTGESVVREELIDAGLIDEGDYNGYGNYVLAVQDLENGNVDAVVLDLPVAETFANERAVEVAFTYETDEEYGFGVRQEDDELREALNDGLITVQEESQYDEFTRTWFAEDDEADGTPDDEANETADDETEAENATDETEVENETDETEADDETDGEDGS